jgi:hypothetical protein
MTSKLVSYRPEDPDLVLGKIFYNLSGRPIGCPQSTYLTVLFLAEDSESGRNLFQFLRKTFCASLKKSLTILVLVEDPDLVLGTNLLQPFRKT